MSRCNWWVDSRCAAVFGGIEAVFALAGEAVSASGESEVLRVAHQGRVYYVKRYWCHGLARWLAKPKVQVEWQNLEHFARWGIGCAPLVAFGLERRCGGFVRGALITEELSGCKDLAQLARSGDARLQDAAFVARIGAQLAQSTRILHQRRFAHNDLKWRNLLADESGNVFFIDCPSGRFWRWPLLEYRIIKDLACLDKLGKYHLTKSQRLRFYLQYAGIKQLAAADKKRIRRILAFFQGRE